MPNLYGGVSLNTAKEGECKMQFVTSKVLSVIDVNLGRCPRCMKTAFLCALFSWPVYFFVQYFWSTGIVPNISILVAIGLTTLWFLHFFSYTVRVLAALWSEYIVSAGSTESERLVQAYGRRDILKVFGIAVGIGVVASIWLPVEAFARGSKCGKGYCPDSAPNCCSRSRGKCCDGNWACTKTGTCHVTHRAARRKCGRNGIVWACS